MNAILHEYGDNKYSKKEVLLSKKSKLAKEYIEKVSTEIYENYLKNTANAVFEHDDDFSTANVSYINEDGVLLHDSFKLMRTLEILDCPNGPALKVE